MELEEVHNCEKCKGKIVCISVDNVGVTRCGYCNAVVDYRPYYNSLYKQDMLDLIENLKIKMEEQKWQKKNLKKKRKKRNVRVLHVETQ
jgi:hypothetical protein